MQHAPESSTSPGSEDERRRLLREARRAERQRVVATCLHVAERPLTLLAVAVVPVLVATAVAAFLFDAERHEMSPSVVPSGDGVGWSLAVAAVLLAAVGICVRRARRRLCGEAKRSVAGVVVNVGAVLAALSVSSAAAFFLLGMHDDHHGRAMRTDALFQKHRSAIMADQERAHASPLVAAIGRQRDAGPLLARHVSWESISTGFVYREAAVPAPKLERLETADDLDSPLSEAVLSIDTAWMRELLAYDHWHIDADPARLDDGSFDAVSAPAPRYQELTWWATLRAHQAMRRGDWREASAEIRRLGSLSASTELILGVMVGLSVYRIDELLHDAVRARHPDVDLSWWQPVRAPERGLVSRASWVALDAWRPYAPASLWRALPVRNAVDCAGVQEALSGMRTLRPWLREELSARLEEAPRILDEVKGVCRFTLLREHWATDPYSDDELTDALVPTMTARWLLALPLVGPRIARMEAASCGFACGVERYEAAAP